MTTTTITRWEVIGSLSCAGFAVRSLGVKTVTGRVPILDAWAEVDAAGRPCAVRATLDLAGLETGNARRDSHLASPRLLDTGHHPKLIFTGRAADVDGDVWRLPGHLTAHGNSIDVVLSVSAQVGDDTVSVHASTSFDRRDLGITAPRFMIGRRIEVTIGAVLQAASGPAAQA
jgi:polyisoprenoid-binding protein YceI